MRTRDLTMLALGIAIGIGLTVGASRLSSDVEMERPATVPKTVEDVNLPIWWREPEPTPEPQERAEKSSVAMARRFLQIVAVLADPRTWRESSFLSSFLPPPVDSGPRWEYVTITGTLDFGDALPPRSLLVKCEVRTGSPDSGENMTSGRRLRVLLEQGHEFELRRNVLLHGDPAEIELEFGGPGIIGSASGLVTWSREDDWACDLGPVPVDWVPPSFEGHVLASDGLAPNETVHIAVHRGSRSRAFSSSYSRYASVREETGHWFGVWEDPGDLAFEDELLERFGYTLSRAFSIRAVGLESGAIGQTVVTDASANPGPVTVQLIEPVEVTVRVDGLERVFAMTDRRGDETIRLVVSPVGMVRDRLYRDLDRTAAASFRLESGVRHVAKLELRTPLLRRTLHLGEFDPGSGDVRLSGTLDFDLVRGAEIQTSNAGSVAATGEGPAAGDLGALPADGPWQVVGESGLRHMRREDLAVSLIPRGGLDVTARAASGPGYRSLEPFRLVPKP